MTNDIKKLFNKIYVGYETPRDNIYSIDEFLCIQNLEKLFTDKSGPRNYMVLPLASEVNRALVSQDNANENGCL